MCGEGLNQAAMEGGGTHGAEGLGMRSGDGGGIREEIQCRFQSQINVTLNSGSLTYYVCSFWQVT